MKTPLIVTASLTVALLSFSSAKAAETTTIAQAGSWSAFAGRSDDGRRLCGMATSGGGRWLGVKYFENDAAVTIQLSKSTWKVRNGVRVRVTMQFDAGRPWRANAEAFHMSHGDAMLEFSIDRNQIGHWADEFWRSEALYIRFPDEDIDDWVADLSGTQEATTAWMLCLAALRMSN